MTSLPGAKDRERRENWVHRSMLLGIPYGLFLYGRSRAMLRV